MKDFVGGGGKEVGTPPKKKDISFYHIKYFKKLRINVAAAASTPSSSILINDF